MMSTSTGPKLVYAGLRRPLVSVHCSSYNHERFIEECVRSVLGQTVDDLEMIVVDDGSTDGTWTLLKSLEREDKRLRVLRHEGSANRGIAATHWLALAHSSGPYLARIDSDDRWAPHKLEVQLPALEEGAILCYGRCRHIDENGRLLPGWGVAGYPPHETWGPGLSPFEGLLIEDYVPPNTAVFPRKAYDRAGGYQPLLAREDWAMWLRLVALDEPVFVDHVLGDRRIHSKEQITMQWLARGEDHHEALKVMENLRHWSDLPEHLVPSVESARRCHEALAVLVGGAPDWPPLSLEEEDARRLMILFHRNRARLARLSGSMRLLRWTGRVLRTGPPFQEEAGSYVGDSFRAAWQERRLRGVATYGAVLFALRIYLLWLAAAERSGRSSNDGRGRS